MTFVAAWAAIAVCQGGSAASSGAGSGSSDGLSSATGGGGRLLHRAARDREEKLLMKKQRRMSNCRLVAGLGSGKAVDLDVCSLHPQPRKSHPWMWRGCEHVSLGRGRTW